MKPEIRTCAASLLDPGLCCEELCDDAAVSAVIDGGLEEHARCAAHDHGMTEQPYVGGFCESCGHFAARHDEQGCHFDRPDSKPDCDCRVMRWQGHDWPRPWLPAPDGMTRDGSEAE